MPESENNVYLLTITYPNGDNQQEIHSSFRKALKAVENYSDIFENKIYTQCYIEGEVASYAFDESGDVSFGLIEVNKMKVL